jgi:hypothetical protein
MTGLIAKVVAFPPPLWGRDREGGNHYRYGFPPPLSPPHKGEGNRAQLRRESR